MTIMGTENQNSSAGSSSTHSLSANAESKPQYSKAKLLQAPRLIEAYKNENGKDEWEVRLKQGSHEFTLRGDTAEKAERMAKPYLSGDKKYDG